MSAVGNGNIREGRIANMMNGIIEIDVHEKNVQLIPISV